MHKPQQTNWFLDGSSGVGDLSIELLMTAKTNVHGPSKVIAVPTVPYDYVCLLRNQILT